MNPRSCRVGLLAAVLGLFAAAAEVARADSRLFGARSSQAGVAVSGAVVNGVQLPIAGQGGGVTFFRIDNPAGAVPCTTRIAFSGSNGAVATVDADICANGGQLTVAFGAASAPPPAAPPPVVAQPPSLPAAPPASPPPLGPGIPPVAGQTVVITTDDPSTSVDAVYLAGREITATRRVGNGVEIRIPPGPGGALCMRDIGLVLSDGRRIARDADFCSGNGQVVVQLIGSGSPPLPPSTGAPPSQPVVPPVAMPQSAGRWMFATDAGATRLMFGIPNTDAIEFNASCVVGSGSVTLTIDRSAPELQPGAAIGVGFVAGAFNRTYSGTGSEVSQMTGESSVLLQVAAADQLWQALIRESFLSIQIGSGVPLGISLSGSAVAVRQFLAACTPRLVQPPPFVAGPPPSPGGGIDVAGGPLPVTYGCEDGSQIYVTYYDDENAALVAEPNIPPRYLRRTPSPSGVRYASGGSQLIGRDTDITWQRSGGFPMQCYPQ